jgi:HEAT repeat protein
MILLPSDYPKTGVHDLLLEAERGRIGFDKRLLASLLERPEETLEALARFTTDPREGVLDLQEQIFDLYRHFGGRPAAEHFAKLLRSKPGEVPDEVIEAIAAQGEAAVEPLLAMHRESGEEESRDAAFVLAAIGVKDPHIEAILRETLERDPYEGALAIGLYGDKSLLPLVREKLASCPAAESQVRKALEDCIEQLEGPAPVREHEPFDILSLYPDASEPLVEVLPGEEVLEFLTCNEPAYRKRAALSFVDDDYDDGIRDALLNAVRTDSDSSVRAACLEALGERVQEAPVRELLLSRIGPETVAAERAGALIGLASDMTDDRVRTAALELYEPDETRAQALEAMWRSRDARFKPHFAPNLKHDDPAVRQQAIHAIGSFPIREHALDLIPLFQDDDVREDALFSYAMAVKTQVTPKSARRLFDDIEDKAGGFSGTDAQAVATALDRRLEEEGFEAMFLTDEHDHDHDGHQHGPANGVVEPLRSDKVGRNDPCPCGSGKKYKKCCGA